MLLCAAVGTAHKPKHNIEQLLGPSPKDLAQMKQQEDAAKKQNDQIDDLLSSAFSTVVQSPLRRSFILRVQRAQT
jgi:hypothetical protein